MKTNYTFSVLRYIHDVVNGEFVNVGVLIYAPDIDYFDARCSKKYGRLSKFFTEIDGDHFRSLMNYIEARVNLIRMNSQGELPFNKKPDNIHELLYTVIPLDDSSLQFSPPGGGITSDIQDTLDDLFHRYVEKYSEAKAIVTRDDEDVWKVFRKPLVEKKLVFHLKPHKIIAKNYEYEFQHAWKNGIWRTLEAVSFDLDHPFSITDKANKWLGRSISLEESDEKFKLYLLLGRPSRESLISAYIKAENILHKIKIEHEFIRETEVKEFAEEVEKDMEQHLNV